MIFSIDERHAIEAIFEKIENEKDIQDADRAYAGYLKEGGIPFWNVKKELGLE